ncbi:MAG: M48 family metalloprotease [Candidatus Saccharibacteria bacterium]
MYSQISANKRKTVIIMAIFLLIIAGLSFFLGWLYKSPSLVYTVLIIGSVYALISYWAGTRWSLALNGAKQIEKKDNPMMWRIIENLSIADGLPMPKVYIIDDPAPNAFATGRDPEHASICATTGLLEIMEKQELEGVFAHEISHIKNYDIRVAMIAFALAAAISIIADVVLRITIFNRDDREQNPVFVILGIIAVILAPIVATMIQLAVSRRREYLADASGALVTRFPEGLESALAKIDKTGSALRKQNTSTAHFFFANPLKGHSLTNLFSTHPPIKDRIAKLKKMEDKE